MNIPSLEAKETINHLAAFGSMLGGESGRDYLQSLADMAWIPDEPEIAEKMGDLLDISEARTKHGK